MTITYTAQVATSSFSCFLKLLARWRGSIYKLLWKDFIVFAVIYYALNFSYRFLMNESQREIFEMIARYCEANNTLIPVAFVLGFYVSLVMTRWWSQLGHIPWPDHMAMFVTANVHGLDERGRLMRRTMLRYMNLAYAITMSSISPAVMKRFPTFQHIVDAGLMMPNEKDILASIETPHNKFFIPLGWTTSLVNRARKEGRIKDDFAVKTLIDEINQFRMHLATLFVYDMITVPLVYTQVVTIAVYMFFLACLMGRQFLNNNPSSPDLYFPVFTFLEYLFYMGWLKVAECFVNPFGEDEDDFDINYLIDRNLQVSYLIVDEIHDEHPDLIRDQYWDNVTFDMPYTACSEEFRPRQPHLGSAIDLSKSYKDKDYMMSKMSLQLIEENDELELETDVEHGGHTKKPTPKPIRLKSTTSYGSYKGSVPSQARRQCSRLSEESCASPSTIVPGSYIGSVTDSSAPRGTPRTSQIIGSPQSPPTATSLWGRTAPPLSSPSSPPTEDYTTQFHLEGLENEEATERDALLKDNVPPEVFELKAIYNRNDSQIGNEPKTRGISTSSAKTPQPRASLSAVEEVSPKIQDDGSQKGSRHLSLMMPKSTVTPSKSTDDTGVESTPFLTAAVEAPSVKWPSLGSASDITVAMAVDPGKGDAARRRIVAPVPQSPDVPPTPALTTPIWVMAPQLSVAPQPAVSAVTQSNGDGAAAQTKDERV